MHAAVFAVIDHTIDHRVAEIADRRIRRNGNIIPILRCCCQLILHELCANVLDSVVQQLTEILSSMRDAGSFRTIGTADLFHLAHDHIRVVDEILIHCQPVCILTEMQPFRFNVQHAVTLLEEDNVRSDFRAGSTLECVVWQTDGSNQVGSLGNILSDRGILLVQCTLRCNECHNTAGSGLIQGVG